MSRTITLCNVKREFPPILLVGAAGDPPDWLAAGAPFGASIACRATTTEARALLDRWEIRLVLAPLQDADGTDVVPLVDEITTRRHGVGVVGLASRLRGHPDDLLRLARSGVHALLFDEDRRAPMVVRRALVEASTRCRSQSFWGDVAPVTPERVRPIVAYGLRHSHEPLTVDAVARALGLHRKTLAERCSLSGSLPPQLMLGWCRLLAAAVLLEDRGRLVDHIALELDFASGTAFRNMLKRYTGLSPAELRAKGPMAELSRQFRRALARAGWRDSVGRVG